MLLVTSSPCVLIHVHVVGLAIHLSYKLVLLFWSVTALFEKKTCFFV